MGNTIHTGQACLPSTSMETWMNSSPLQPVVVVAQLLLQLVPAMLLLVMVELTVARSVPVTMTMLVFLLVLACLVTTVTTTKHKKISALNNQHIVTHTLNCYIHECALRSKALSAA